MKIAAFDSGIGGLTAIVPLLKKYPHADLTYLGDLANLPYGTKSPERIQQLTEKNITWLLQNQSNLDFIIVACNTASAHALDAAQRVGQKFSVPVIGVLEPGCRAALKSQAQRVVVLATAATVKSEAYLKKLKQLGCTATIVQKACPLFVPLVEDHLYSGVAVESIARRYLDDSLQKGDAVILGCTHYPFLSSTLAKLYPGIEWIDAGGALLNDEQFKSMIPHKRVAESKSTFRLLFTDQTADRAKIEILLKDLGVERSITSFDFIRMGET